MKPKTIIFDIETGPLPPDELAKMIPPFDPTEVKCGNIKDADKIAAKIAEAKATHERDSIERAALDPLTGQVLAIGIMSVDAGGETLDFCNNTIEILGDKDEAKTINEFWTLIQAEFGRLYPIVGFNINGFDLPFLIRRSWKHGISIPRGLRRGRYWGDQVIDLREEWQCGDRMAKGSLDSIAKHFGVGAKNGDGKQFSELWATDRDKAIEYLANDLRLTAKVAQRMGIAI